MKNNVTITSRQTGFGVESYGGKWPNSDYVKKIKRKQEEEILSTNQSKLTTIVRD